MRLVFMGSDAIALPMLEALSCGRCGPVEIAGIFTQPDRARGRGHKVSENAIKRWGRERDIAIYQPERCNDEACVDLESLAADFVLVMAYGQLLPKRMLGLLPGKFLNMHASLLPRLRGASPIHTALGLGLKETGVSLMQIEPKMDAGPVADRETVSIESTDRLADLATKLGEACVPLVCRAFPLLREGRLSFEAQDPKKVTYCRIITKTDAYLDFRFSANELENRIRALNPWPGPRFPYGNDELRIHSAQVVEGVKAEPGTLLESPSGGLRIACGRNALDVLEIQRPGGRVLPVHEFLRGYPIQIGEVLESREMIALER